MFWRRKTIDSEGPVQTGPTYEEAKEATRRATFLNVGQRITDDEAYRQSLSELFRVCHAAAVTAGAAEGYSESQVDAEIGAICDADIVRLKGASDEEFREFTKESGEIIKAFLAAHL